MQLMKVDDPDIVDVPSVHLGQRLRAARQKHRLSQVDVAERLGISGQTISLWEGGAAIGANNVKPLRALLDELERSVPGPEADPAFAIPGPEVLPSVAAIAVVTKSAEILVETETPAETPMGRKPASKAGRGERRQSIAPPLAETPTLPEKSRRQQYFELLTAKLPPFDGTWPREAQDCWLQAFGILVDSLEAL